MNYEARTAANLGAIGKAGQMRLLHSCIGVAGLGGVGGIAFELLVRAGVGEMKIADSGFFEEKNANRQSLWAENSDGRKKTDVALEFSAGINAGCKIRAFGAISMKNAAPFAKGCDAVIDATDSAQSRLGIWNGCRKARVPYIFASARESRGMLTVFLPENPPSGFFSRKIGSCRFGCDHALGPVANTMGCLAAQQALNFVLGKPLLSFPKVLSFDAFFAPPVSIHCF